MSALNREPVPAHVSSIEDGVEFWIDATTGVYDEQCARCGSSVTRIDTPTLDDAEAGFWQCVSSAEWCESHPIAGRESQKGAGR